ncbi:hypothetical protein M413DRAFT_31935 [Hebeloma cylindrosporum]|uniref:DUF7770 domain-containing protein n=1 Tax=Hebeloma cylindrosporum TaxID=76867 RepID=A0A0C3BVU4_HEBCY|nr:hypothetical protein M413DRAFT_31935 [Hebeloma cylindrosporum h7]
MSAVFQHAVDPPSLAGHENTTRLRGLDGKLGLQVGGIIMHACRSPMYYPDGTSGVVAHFRLFLVISDDSSIELNSSGDGEIVTKLEIIFRNYQFSKTDSYIGVVKIPVIRYFTVRDVMDNLFSNNRDRYRLEETRAVVVAIGATLSSPILFPGVGFMGTTPTS